MHHDLSDFFASYPENLLQLLRVSENSLDPKLIRELNDYGDRQRFILQGAHVFRFDAAAEQMMMGVISQMKKEGLEDLYHTVRMPFPVMLLEAGSPSPQLRTVGLVTQVGETLYTQRFLLNTDGLVPSRFVFESSGLTGNSTPTPTRDLLELAAPADDVDKIDEAETQGAKQLIAVAVALSTLLGHKGMLEVDEGPAYSRPERRRAEREGRPLPATRVSRITLGQAGRGQLEAMNEDATESRDKRGNKRTHWVRGHPMRNRSGGISWRMPHLRGAGPLISQRREVTAARSLPEDFGHEDGY